MFWRGVLDICSNVSWSYLGNRAYNSLEGVGKQGEGRGFSYPCNSWHYGLSIYLLGLLQTSSHLWCRAIWLVHRSTCWLQKTTNKASLVIFLAYRPIAANVATGWYRKMLVKMFIGNVKNDFMIISTLTTFMVHYWLWMDHVCPHRVAQSKNGTAETNRSQAQNVWRHRNRVNSLNIPDGVW